MPGGGGKQVTNVQSGPPAFQQPFIQAGLQGAQADVLNTPSMTPDMEQALQLQRSLALDPNSAFGQSANYYKGLLGQDPYSGPAAQAASNYVNSTILPQIDSRFALGNRAGGGLHGEAIGRGVALGLTPFMESQANRQFQAAALAPQAELGPSSLLGNVGQAYQDAPYERLRRYMGLVGGSFGQNSTQTSPTQGSSPLLGALGGAGLGAGIASMGGLFGSAATPTAAAVAASPWAWPLVIGGGVLGGLGGMF